MLENGTQNAGWSFTGIGKEECFRFRIILKYLAKIQCIIA